MVSHETRQSVAVGADVPLHSEHSVENAQLLKELEFFNEYMITGGTYESERGSSPLEEITPHMVFMALNERRQVNAIDLMTSNQRDMLLNKSAAVGDGPPVLGQMKSSP